MHVTLTPCHTHCVSHTLRLAPTATMETYKGRLDSFSGIKRVKNPTLTSSASIKWTHPSSFAATPKTLAEAGFYFNPSWEDRDNVTCFTCGKELGGWAAQDDPFEIHWSKCNARCVWAVVRCGLRDDLDEDGRCVSSGYDIG